MKEFFEDLFTASVGTSITWQSFLITMAFSLVCGVILALGYMLITRKEGNSSYFIAAMTILPSIIAVIIMLVGSNIARAFSLGGVFALTRFRSEQGNPRDIACIAITMAVGLACGTGYIAYGVLFSVLITIVLIIIKLIGFGETDENAMMLKITMPEDLDFENAFEEVFEKYTKYHKLDRVKTADFGSLYQIQFTTALKDGVVQKEFLDEIRTINSNLNVAMSSIVYEEGRKTF